MIMSWTAHTSEGIVRLWEQFLNQLIAPRTNAWTILKADNYNKYNYYQALGKKHTGQRRYTIKCLSMRSSYKVRIKGLDQVRDLILRGWWRKINSRAVLHRIQLLLVLLSINAYAWLKELSIFSSTPLSSIVLSYMTSSYDFTRTTRSTKFYQFSIFPQFHNSLSYVT